MERTLLALVLAYLLGAIPFAYLITKWRTGLDIRRIGDGNPGSRNVLHMVGMRWGILAAVLDTAKGYLAYTLAQMLATPFWAVLATGFAAALGHGFSIFLRGHGGKSVAVSLGFLLGLMPISTLIGLGLLGGTNLLFRDFNLGLTLAVASMVVSAPLLGGNIWLSLYVVALFLAIAAKKALDLPQERKIWAQDPWRDISKPDWFMESEPLARAGPSPEVAPPPG